ncbi:MAG: hypothetical protein AB7E51_06675 [Pseudodesulfovibrio sp.]|uniref:hypothetical protein n=1 Tax=Pseudodesulfovibrio sp. TaxID=2035812 RepID=UPI003D09A869
MIVRPVSCPEHLRPAVEWMLLELDRTGLVVDLVPAPDQRHHSHMIRVAAESNPEWYRDVLALYPRGRRNRDARYTDATINRRDVRRVIERLLGTGTRSAMAAHILAHAQGLHDQYNEEAA